LMLKEIKQPHEHVHYNKNLCVCNCVYTCLSALGFMDLIERSKIQNSCFIHPSDINKNL